MRVSQKDYALWPDNFKDTLTVKRTKIFILKAEDTEDLAKLQAMYPERYNHNLQKPARGQGFLYLHCSSPGFRRVIMQTSNETSKKLKSWWVDLILIIVLLAGAYLRVVGIRWDETYHLHPDERFLTMVETGIAPVTVWRNISTPIFPALIPKTGGMGFLFTELSQFLLSAISLNGSIKPDMTRLPSWGGHTPLRLIC